MFNSEHILKYQDPNSFVWRFTV